MEEGGLAGDGHGLSESDDVGNRSMSGCVSSNAIWPYPFRSLLLFIRDPVYIAERGRLLSKANIKFTCRT